MKCSDQFIKKCSTRHIFLNAIWKRTIQTSLTEQRWAYLLSCATSEDGAIKIGLVYLFHSAQPVSHVTFNSACKHTTTLKIKVTLPWGCRFRLFSNNCDMLSPPNITEQCLPMIKAQKCKTQIVTSSFFLDPMWRFAFPCLCNDNPTSMCNTQKRFPP